MYAEEFGKAKEGGTRQNFGKEKSREQFFRPDTFSQNLLLLPSN